MWLSCLPSDVVLLFALCFIWHHQEVHGAAAPTTKNDECSFMKAGEVLEDKPNLRMVGLRTEDPKNREIQFFMRKASEKGPRLGVKDLFKLGGTGYNLNRKRYRLLVDQATPDHFFALALVENKDGNAEVIVVYVHADFEANEIKILGMPSTIPFTSPTPFETVMNLDTVFMKGTVVASLKSVCFVYQFRDGAVHTLVFTSCAGNGTVVTEQVLTDSKMFTQEETGQCKNQHCDYYQLGKNTYASRPTYAQHHCLWTTIKGDKSIFTIENGKDEVCYSEKTDFNVILTDKDLTAANHEDLDALKKTCAGNPLKGLQPLDDKETERLADIRRQEECKKNKVNVNKYYLILGIIAAVVTLVSLVFVLLIIVGCIRYKQHHKLKADKRFDKRQEKKLQRKLKGKDETEGDSAMSEVSNMSNMSTMSTTGTTQTEVSTTGAPPSGATTPTGTGTATSDPTGGTSKTKAPTDGTAATTPDSTPSAAGTSQAGTTGDVANAAENQSSATPADGGIAI